jgi:hypothetical protein
MYLHKVYETFTFLTDYFTGFYALFKRSLRSESLMERGYQCVQLTDFDEIWYGVLDLCWKLSLVYSAYFCQFTFFNNAYCSRDSSVNKVTDYGLHDRGSLHGRCRDFSLLHVWSLISTSPYVVAWCSSAEINFTLHSSRTRGHTD